LKRAHRFEYFDVKWLARYGWIVDRPPAVVVVPCTADGSVWLIRIHRPPTRASTWELPGGEIQKRESPTEAALRELDEETGLIASGGTEELGWPLEAAPGMGRIPHHIVIARDVVPRDKRVRLQRSEGITQARPLSREQVGRYVKSGQIRVFATIGALAVTGWLG
jgi:ADP-ribose pyrophosphatase